jgi:hypothetical protein
MMEHKIFSFKIKQGNGSKYAEVWNECQGKKDTVLGLAHENEVEGRQYYKTRISQICTDY